MKLNDKQDNLVVQGLGFSGLGFRVSGFREVHYCSGFQGLEFRESDLKSGAYTAYGFLVVRFGVRWSTCYELSFSVTYLSAVVHVI